MGVAEGPVRIIRDSSEFGKLRSGGVSVAPHTNRAWTQHFQRAAAVVVDSGGQRHTQPLWHAQPPSDGRCCIPEGPAAPFAKACARTVL
jgi:hypothetical protein